MTQDLLCYFVSFLGEKGLGHSTIKSYLAAVRSLQIDYGFQNPFGASMPKLERIMKGIKVSQGKEGRATRRKLPITPKILRPMRAQWNATGFKYEETMLWAAATVCFFGFMRAGELTTPDKGSFDPSQHLTMSDLATDDLEHPTLVQVTLKSSKTDPFRQGVTITLGETGNELCPVRALFDYLRVRGNPPGPLFLLGDGSPMTRSYFTQKIRATLRDIGFTDYAQYSGHSFRVGAATTAAALNVEDSIIQTLGRWQSTAYLLYVRIPREELKGICSTLAQYGEQK